MNKKSRICIVLSFLTLSAICSAQVPPGITISVHNYADVSDKALEKAEGEARRIFQQAGVRTIWLNCSPKLEEEKRHSANCSLVDDSHLALKILQTVENSRLGESADVLGTAILFENKTAYYAYAYYDRIQQLAESRNLGDELLAAVLVHEIGHLLLESNAHSLSGIMCARWSGDELRQVSEGIMYFTPVQSRQIRARVDQISRSTDKEAKLSTISP